MDCKIIIMPQQTSITAVKGETLLSALVRAGFYLPAPCGGNGTCGKCKVQILQGKMKNVTPDKEGYVLSCKGVIDGDLTVLLSVRSGSGVTDFKETALKGEETGFGVALDIGTTTLAACLVRLDTGETLKKISTLNPQGVYGADVLSRIAACREGKLEVLQKLILDKTNECIETLSEGSPVKELTVAANTTMLHLFFGVNPETIGVAPFLPVFTEMQVCEGKKLGVSAEKVRLLPSASAYIGGDVTAGGLFCGLHQRKETELFVDIGTNGEIVLAHKGQLYATSTAAGPALEGAGIECGMSGVTGAIDKVFTRGGKLEYTTIGDGEAKGICGSGLIDLIALLLKEKMIDESGAWAKSYSALSKNMKECQFFLTDTVYLSQGDIRQFQLAKAAIRAGIETLLKRNQVKASEVQKVYVAGGLGYYMNVQSALETGLLPPSFSGKIEVVGNTSLAGAKLCLLQDKALDEIRGIAEKTQAGDLSLSKGFAEMYMENMCFEAGNDS